MVSESGASERSEAVVRELCFTFAEEKGIKLVAFKEVEHKSKVLNRKIVQSFGIEDLSYLFQYNLSFFFLLLSKVELRCRDVDYSRAKGPRHLAQLHF